VSVVTRNPSDCGLVKTVTFRHDNMPTLFQLAVAASVVHHDSPRYHLFRSQCYWFADVLLRVLQRTYKATVDHDGNPDEDDEVQVPKGVDAEEFLQGIADGVIDDHRQYAKGGKLMHVRIYSAKEKVIKRVMKEYARRLALIQAEVEEEFHRRQEQAHAEADLRREREERQREREERQREWEERQREREERQREQEERQREREAFQRQVRIIFLLTGHMLMLHVD
jgi:hypothetical protein